MWLDNASSIDMLFYSPYADTIVSFTKNAYLTPMTIGLYGSWGAGKSSLLQLIEQRIEDDRDDDVVCVSLNAWQFEGYEDAKVAIMESLLKTLKEKIIQLPIKIPELSPKDIENYLLLLVSQLHISEDGFTTLIKEIYDSGMMLRDKALTYSEVAAIIGNRYCSYKEDASKSLFDADASIISKISPTVSSSLKGNPRQAKRFLNTFFVRKNLASLYFGEDIDLSVMAKLLALETIEIRAFRKLYEWSSDFDGEIKQLKEIECLIKDGKEFGEEYALWAAPRITKWLKSEPIELYKQDLSKYFYLSREALSSVESISSTFSESERKMLSAFQNCMKGQEDSRIEELKKMESVSQRNVCDALIEHFKADSVGLNIIAPIYCNYADFRTDISEAILQKPSTFFTMAVIPHMVIMYKASPTQFDSSLKEDFSRF